MEGEARQYYCSYPGFVDICHVMYRNIDRLGIDGQLILCTLPVYDSEYENSLRVLEKAILKSIRSGDVFTTHGNIGFLLLIMGDEKESSDVCSRINSYWKIESGRNEDLQFECSPLSSLGA